MILLIDTSLPLVKIAFVENGDRRDFEWQADRNLARDLLGYLDRLLKSNQLDWISIKGIGVFKGPGSFTGLRIGLTVMNTIADANGIPIIGATGEDWTKDALESLKNGQNDKIVIPFYGGEANITKPRK